MPNRTWRRRWNWPLALLSTLGAALGFAFSAAAQDDTDDMYAQPGVYLIAQGVFALPTERGDLADDAVARRLGTGARRGVDNTFGAAGRLGYRLHPRVALESQFEYLNAIEIDFINSSGTKSKDEFNLFSVTGNAKGYLATGRFQPYAVAGAGWMRSRLDPAGQTSNSRKNGFTARFGAGFDVYGSPDVALTVESTYVLATGGTSELDHVSIGAGLMLRFYGLD